MKIEDTKILGLENTPSSGTRRSTRDGQPCSPTRAVFKSTRQLRSHSNK